MPPTAISDKGLSADWCLIKRSDRSSLKDIVRVQDYRQYIIEYTARRLTLTKQEAAKYSYLQDEYLAQRKEYHFRVTQRPFSTRIHYKYVNKKLRFLRYYGELEHDNGL